MKKTIIMILTIFNCSFAFAATNNIDIDKEIKFFRSKTEINPQVLQLGLKAFAVAQNNGDCAKPILTVVDYSLPSTAKRMWVLDLANNKVLFNTFVSHGKNSGDKYATSFSDKMGTLKSSMGVFVTENTYDGHEGYSLNLKGLEAGINGRAEERRIVMHGAWYVSEVVVKMTGMLGRSWGCFAVNDKLAAPIINTVKDGSLIFAYYPDQKWLKHSKYLALN